LRDSGDCKTSFGFLRSEKMRSGFGSIIGEARRLGRSALAVGSAIAKLFLVRSCTRAAHRVHSVATSIARCEDVRVAREFALARLSPMQGVNVAIATGLILALAAVCWVPHLPASLWLDETLTFWVIRDGLAETLERTIHYQPQPAYYIFIWFWTQIAGVSEIALRIPSLLATLAACVALARLGTSLTRDRETGLLAAVVFASSWNVFRESVDARSYMLGVLVLLCLALSLIRWIEEGRWCDAWLCGVLAAVLPSLHLFFVLTYPALGLYALLRRSEARFDVKQVGLVGLLLLLGAFLFLPVGLMLLEHGGSYSFVPRPQWRALFEVFAWIPPLVGLLVAIALSGIWGSRSSASSDSDLADSRGLSRESGVLLAVWMFLPLLLLFAVSKWTDMSVFLGRYLIPAIPAVCLFYAIALRGIGWGPARVVAVVVIALASFVIHERPHDDFRGAALAVNEFTAGDDSTPILLASGLIEGEDENWLRDPTLADYLNAPAEYYPLEGQLVTLPRRLRGHPMASEIVEPILRRADRFVAIEWIGNGAQVLQPLIQRADAAGYRVVRRGFGGVRVAFFDYEGVAPQP